MNNIPSSGLFHEDLIGKVRRKLESILKVNERCLEGCAPPIKGAAMVCGVSEIVAYPLPDQLQDSFRVPCAFQSIGWNIRKVAVKGLSSAMDLPQENSSEALVFDSVSDGEGVDRFYNLVAGKCQPACN